MRINIPGISEVIDGEDPIVILGANGSGKTRLAVQIANSGSAEFIPALRNIAVPDQIPNWTLQTATNELQSRTNQRRNSYWELVQDVDALFGKLWSSHAVEAMRVYDQVLQGAKLGELPETVLTRTKELWRQVFPGRTITFTDFTATVTNDYFGATTYTAKHMSDGERTGLYLAGRVFDSANPVVVVDEPETHFHSRLAVRFWDALEDLARSKRFVYVTHDLNFALSRRGARVVLVRPNQSPELILPGASLPPDDVASILGAASFSIYASRIVFCEGREEKSLDQELLRAWFNDRDTALIPVGGCDNVKRCTAAFQTTSVVSGLNAIGIVDRDHWPDEMLSGSASVHVLEVHEIESLYVLKPVYAAIAVHSGHKPDDVDRLYAELLGGFRRQMSGQMANKLLCDRFKARSLWALERAFTSDVHFDNREVLKRILVAEVPNARPVVSAEAIWDEEEKFVESALATDDPVHFLRVFPGKPLLGLAAKSLGLTKERYCELLKTGLGSSSGSTFGALHSSLESALAPYLPPRRASHPPHSPPKSSS